MHAPLMEGTIEAFADNQMIPPMEDSFRRHLAICSDCMDSFARLLGRRVIAATGWEQASAKVPPFEWSAATHVGDRRVQEDRWLVVTRGDRLLAAVMDGVAEGGHGGEAAQAVKESLARAAEEHLATTPASMLWLVLRDGFSAAVKEVSGSRGATTATAVVLDAWMRRGWFGHVGDSGLVRIRAGAADRLTQVHREGPYLSKWLGGVGHAGSKLPDFKGFAFAERDELVLATDGVLDSVAFGERGRRASDLVTTALRNRRQRQERADNSTAVVVRV